MKQTHTSLGKTSLALPSAWSPFPWPHVALGPLGEAAGRQEMGSAHAGSCSGSRPSGAIPLGSAPACTFFLLASHSSCSGLVVHLGFFGVYCPLLNMFSQRLSEVLWFRGGTHVADGARLCSVVGPLRSCLCLAWDSPSPLSPEGIPAASCYIKHNRLLVIPNTPHAPPSTLLWVCMSLLFFFSFWSLLVLLFHCPLWRFGHLLLSGNVGINWLQGKYSWSSVLGIVLFLAYPFVCYNIRETSTLVLLYLLTSPYRV